MCRVVERAFSSVSQHEDVGKIISECAINSRVFIMYKININKYVSGNHGREITARKKWAIDIKPKECFFTAYLYCGRVGRAGKADNKLNMH